MDTAKASATTTPEAARPVVVEVPEPAGEAPSQPAAPARSGGINKRLVKRATKRVIGLALLIGAAIAGVVTGLYFVTAILAFYVLCGILDVARNKPVNYATVDRYFFGNGVLTWLLSPFNLLMDLISLPYRNKGIYRLEDLPEVHQREITAVLDAAKEANIIQQLEDKITDSRSMIFFKWYGKNLPVSVDIPAFHEEYETIRTIGVSIFNKRKSTSWHFGPLRATFRVLYNLRPTQGDAAFIQVGSLVHRWNAQPLFIFDDTLVHQSRNETDEVRYCMFIDIVRPNAIGPVMNAIVVFLQFLLIRINRKFYKRWSMIK